MIRPEQMPYSVGLIFRDGKPLVYASGDFPKSQARALALSDYRRLSRAPGEGARARAAISASASATTSKAPGSGRSRASPCACCRTARSRSRPAPPRRGKAPRTTLAQIVADQVGCRLDDIVMTVGDTAAISQGIGAFASRQAINAGSSALIAGDNVRQQIVALAARTLGVPEAEIDVEDGRATARTGNKPSMSLGELARLAQGMPGFSFAPGQTPGLEHTAYFTPPQASYCNGTHVAEVEVDPMTGGVTAPQLHGGA